MEVMCHYYALAIVAPEEIAQYPQDRSTKFWKVQYFSPTAVIVHKQSLDELVWDN
jgi:hypothetical protein